MSSWRNSREYRIWRYRVIKRDKRCMVCNSIKRRHAHHIESASYNKELRFVVSNGICLCSECHSRFHNDFVGNYRKKTTKYQLDNFIQLSKYFKKKFSK